MFGTSAVEFSGADSEVTSRIAKGIKQLEQLFHEVLMRDRKNGAISAKHNLRTTARQLTATFYGLQVMANANMNREELDQIASNAVKMLD